MKWKLKLATVLFLTLAIFASGAWADFNVDPTDFKLAVGETKQMAITGDPGGTVTWLIDFDRTDIATVSPTGLVTAVSAGYAGVTVKVGDVERTALLEVTGGGNWWNIGFSSIAFALVPLLFLRKKK